MILILIARQLYINKKGKPSELAKPRPRGIRRMRLPPIPTQPRKPDPIENNQRGRGSIDILYCEIFDLEN